MLKKIHSSAKQKREAKTTFEIKEEDMGNLISNAIQIRNEGVKFFKDLLTLATHPSPLDSQVNEILASIPKLVSPHENTMLVAPFTIQEIKNVVFFSPQIKPRASMDLLLYFFKVVGILLVGIY